MIQQAKRLAVAYYRYSSRHQNETSIEEQRAFVERYAAENGYELVGEFIDRELSGATVHRPGFTRLLEDAAASDWKYIIVWRQDRLSREDVAAYFGKVVLPLRDAGKILVTTDRGERDWTDGASLIIESVHANEDNSYCRKISTGIIRHQSELARDGRYPHKAPYGYDRNPETQRLEINETEAAVVRLIFQKYLEGLSVAEVATWLRENGYRFREGRKWATITVRRTLKARVYLGEVHYGQGRTRGKFHSHEELIVTTGAHPPIVSTDLFAAAQEARQRNGRRPGPRKRHYLLTGLLKCAHCGGPMNAFVDPRAKNPTVRYICGRNRNTGECDQANWVREDAVLDAMLGQLRERYDNEENIAAMRKAVTEEITAAHAATNTDALATDLRRVEKDLEKLRRNLPTCDPDVFPLMQARYRELTAERDQLAARYDAAATPLAVQLAEGLKRIDAAVAAFAKFDQTIRELDTLKARTILDLLLEEIVVKAERDRTTGGSRGRWVLTDVTCKLRHSGCLARGCTPAGRALLAC